MSDFSKLAETEYLISAAVGENWFLPIHELMETAHLLHDIHSGTEIQMVRIPKNYLSTNLHQFTLLNRFYRPLCADGHKNRRFDNAVICFENSCPG